MKDPYIVTGLSMDKIGAGPTFVLLAWRSILDGRAGCCRSMGYFKQLFGMDGVEARGGLVRFTHCLSEHGERTIRIAAPGCLSITTDEFTFLNLFEALERGDNEAASQSVRSLFGGNPPHDAIFHALTVLGVMRRHRLTARVQGRAQVEPAPESLRGSLGPTPFKPAATASDMGRPQSSIDLRFAECSGSA